MRRSVRLKAALRISMALACLFLAGCKFPGFGQKKDTQSVGLLLLGPAAIEESHCSGPFVIKGTWTDTTSGFAAGTRFTIAGVAETEIFADSNCTDGALGGEIPAGAGQEPALFYLKTSQASEITLTVSSGTMASATLSLKALPASDQAQTESETETKSSRNPTQLLLETARAIEKNRCSEIRARLADSEGESAAARSDLNVRLFALGGTKALFYDNEDCDETITLRPIEEGNEGFSVYVRAGRVGKLTLSFDSRDSEIAEATKSVRVVPRGSVPRSQLQLEIATFKADEESAKESRRQPASKPSEPLAAVPEVVPPPTLTQVLPKEGPSQGGVAITLVGTNLKEGVTLSISDKPCTPVTFISATEVNCTLPAVEVGDAVIAAKNPDGQSTKLFGKFTVNPPPTITRVDPTRIPSNGGQWVVVTGTHFGKGATVSIGGANCFPLKRDSLTQLSCHSPALASPSVDIVVRNPDGQTVTVVGAFSTDPSPSLVSISPAKGPAGGSTRVTLSGDKFVAGATVKLGALNCTAVTVPNPQQLECKTPMQMPLGPTDILVRNPDGQAAFLKGAFQAEPPPAISSISPDHGPVVGNTTLTISGAAFAPGATVKVGKNDCASPVIKENLITCLTPAGTGRRLGVKVQNSDGQTAQFMAFAYDPAPTISRVEPSRGPSSGAVPITIWGDNLGVGVSAAIGNQGCLSLTRNGPTKLICTIPALNAGKVDVTVKNTDGQIGQLMGAFDVDPPPTIMSVSPASGPSTGQTQVVIEGTHFISGARVDLGGSACASVNVSDTKITCTTLPHAAGNVGITVTSPDGQTAGNATAFTYDAAPNITSVSPANGPSSGGTSIILTGNHFVSGASILVGGLNCGSITISSPTQASCVVPAHAAGKSDVVIANPDTQRFVLTGGFVFDPPPRITRVIPSHGPASGNGTIEIRGDHFVAGSVVKIDGTNCDAAFVNPKKLTCTLLAHAPGPVMVEVETPDSQSFKLASGYLFDPAPTIVAISPTKGSADGGTPLTISGTGFVKGMAINIGGSQCGSARLVSSKEIKCITTAHAPGASAVRVTNSDGQFAENENAYNYLSAPLLSKATPERGPVSGKTTLEIEGHEFENGAIARVGGTPCISTTVASSTRLTCVTAPHSAGSFPIEVENPDGQLRKLAMAYTYDPPPVVSHVEPKEGPTSGDIPITIHGSNFSRVTRVTLEGSVCEAVNVVSNTQVNCRVPAHALGKVTVVVSTSDEQAGTLKNGFSYHLPAPEIAEVSPGHGPATGGVLLSIRGSNLNFVSSVKTGNLECSEPHAISNAEFQCKTPPQSPGVYSLRVVNPDGRYATQAGFIIDAPPKIVSVDPNHGRVVGGTAIRVRGSGFQETTRVSLGGSDCGSLKLISEKELRCTTGVGNGGSVEAKVTNTDGQQSVLAMGYTFDPPPTVSAVSPEKVPASIPTAVNIRGTDFVNGVIVTLAQGNSTVPCQKTKFVSAARVECLTPVSAPGSYSLTVTNPDGQTVNQTPVELVAPPTVTAINPVRGSMKGRTAITISGTGFTAGATVKLGSSACLTVTIQSAQALTCISSASNPGNFEVTLTNPDQQKGTLANGYIFDAPPIVTRIDPLVGPASGGTKIVVSGVGFLPGLTAQLGESICSVSGDVTSTSFSCTTSRHEPGIASMRVLNPDGQSGTLDHALTYLAPPKVTRVNPKSAPSNVATVIVISGQDFQGGATVMVGDVPCENLIFSSGSQLRCKLPPHAEGPMAVVVKNPDGQTTTLNDGFIYDGPTKIVSVLPSSGSSSGGTAITISGSGFVEGAIVDIGGSPCAVSALVSDQVNCTTSAHLPGATQIKITNPDQQVGHLDNAYTYNIPPPAITSVSFRSGIPEGEMLLTIDGAHFSPTAKVRIDNAPCTGVVVSGRSRIQCLIGSHPPGKLDVTVINSDNQSGTLSSEYSSTAAPAILGVDPSFGRAPGGEEVIVFGSNFRLPLVVKLGEVECVSPGVNSFGTAISCITGKSTPGTVDVTVIQDDSVVTKSQAFTYQPPPSIIAVIPNRGPTAGGVAVTIEGRGFSPGSIVRIDGTACLKQHVKNSREIECVLPPRVEGTYAIEVTNADAQRSRVALFTYDTENYDAVDCSRAAVSNATSSCTENAYCNTAAVCHVVRKVGPTVEETYLLRGVQEPRRDYLYSVNDDEIQDSEGYKPEGKTFRIFTGKYEGTVPIYRLVQSDTRTHFYTADVDKRNTLLESGWQYEKVDGYIFSEARPGLLEIFHLFQPETGANLYTTNLTERDEAIHQGFRLQPRLGYTLGPQPELASVNPSSGGTQGGALLKISGKHLLAPASIKIGESKCSNATLISDSEIRCVTSPGKIGSQAMEVVFVDGQKDDLTDAFEYHEPTLTAVAPNRGPVTGGTLITLTGEGFSDPIVTIGGKYCEVDESQETIITCRAPIGESLARFDVKVENADQSFVTLKEGFTYTDAAGAFHRVFASKVNNLDTDKDDEGVADLLCGLEARSAGLSGYWKAVVSDALLTVNGPVFSLDNRLVATSGSELIDKVIRAPEKSPLPVVSAHDRFDRSIASVSEPNDDTDTFYCISQPVPMMPTISNVYPAYGDVSGGTLVTVQGDHFRAGLSAEFGGAPCVLLGKVTKTTFSCATTTHSAGISTLRVRNSDGSIATAPNVYQYAVINLLDFNVPLVAKETQEPDRMPVSVPVPKTHPISIASIYPPLGSQGTRIDIMGSGFAPGAKVTVGSVDCLTAFISPTALRCTVPESKGAVNVSVTNQDGGRAVLKHGFTYTDTPFIPAINRTSNENIHCVSFTQISVPYGNLNYYEWSALWVQPPAELSLFDGAGALNAIQHLAFRVSDANWGMGHGRTPSPISLNYHDYPNVVPFGGHEYHPTTNGNLGSVECPAFFSDLYSPLVVDLNNEGITLSAPNEGVLFDVLGHGYRNRIAWPRNPASSQFLVLDRDQNGRIESVHELFGNNTVGPDRNKATNGFEALAKYDTNADRLIDARDSIYSDLRLWNDKNRNGTTETGELIGLSAKGVKAIDLHYANIHERNDFYGNESLERSVVILKSGDLRRVVDIWFAPGIRKDEPTLSDLELLEKIHEKSQKGEWVAVVNDKLGMGRGKTRELGAAPEIEAAKKMGLLQVAVFQNNLQPETQGKMGSVSPSYMPPEQPMVRRTLGETGDALRAPIKDRRGLSDVLDEIFSNPSAAKLAWVLGFLLVFAAAITFFLQRKQS